MSYKTTSGWKYLYGSDYKQYDLFYLIAFDFTRECKSVAL